MAAEASIGRRACAEGYLWAIGDTFCSTAVGVLIKEIDQPNRGKDGLFPPFLPQVNVPLSEQF